MAYDLPTEIVTVILSNLGQSDLLGCRLVNHSWNRESLRIFRKSTFRTHLNIRQSGGNVNDYIEFASTQNPQLVLPIHLSLEGFRLPHSKIVEIVTSLQTISGPDSIQSFTLDIHCHVEIDKTVMILLSKISHALKTLKIEMYFVESREQFVLDPMKDLKFPNVTSLKYLTLTTFRRIEIQSQFILKCPNLTELYLESESPEVPFSPTLQTLILKSLTDIPKFRNNILECFRLHTLKIYKYNKEDRQIMVSILESLEKTLKSLTIYADPMFIFPRLPCLESLRLLGTREMCTMIGVNPDRIHLNSENHPSLKYVDLPFIFYIASGSPLPSVKTLVLTVFSLPNICRNPSVNHNLKANFPKQEYFKNVKILFPNVTTISLKQKNLDRFQCKTVLKELICSELAPQIEEIQIKGVNRDILGEALEQNMVPPQISMVYSGHRDLETEALIQKAFELWTGKIGIEGIECRDEGAGPGKRILFSEGTQSQSGHKMTNVKKVKIVFSRGSGGKSSDYKLNLMTIARNFPGLTEIEIFGFRSELYSKEFHDLAIEYPNLLLRISKLASKI